MGFVVLKMVLTIRYIHLKYFKLSVFGQVRSVSLFYAPLLLHIIFFYNDVLRVSISLNVDQITHDLCGL